MKQSIAALSLLTLSLAILPASAQIVLNFDDVNTGGLVVPMPAGYGGITWAANVGIWGQAQPPYNPQSNPNRVLFNLNGETGFGETFVTFTGGPKIFDGAYFSGYDYVLLNLYSGATLVATSSVLTFDINGSGPTFLTSGYAGPVDRIGIYGYEGLFAMDNFTFEPVPEPSTLSLVAIGIVALRLKCRSKRCQPYRLFILL